MEGLESFLQRSQVFCLGANIVNLFPLATSPSEPICKMNKTRLRLGDGQKERIYFTKAKTAKQKKKRKRIPTTFSS